jgi:hypothetical protein
VPPLNHVPLGQTTHLALPQSSVVIPAKSARHNKWVADMASPTTHYVRSEQTSSVVIQERRRVVAFSNPKTCPCRLGVR